MVENTLALVGIMGIIVSKPSRACSLFSGRWWLASTIQLLLVLLTAIAAESSTLSCTFTMLEACVWHAVEFWQDFLTFRNLIRNKNHFQVTAYSEAFRGRISRTQHRTWSTVGAQQRVKTTDLDHAVAVTCSRIGWLFLLPLQTCKWFFLSSRSSHAKTC